MRGLPIATVGFPHCDALDRIGVYAVGIDTESVGTRPGNIEGLDSANRAERVFGGVRIERVGRENVSPGEQPEAICRDAQMPVT